MGILSTRDQNVSVADPEEEIKTLLRTLRQAAREKVADEDRVGSLRVPDGLRTPQDPTSLVLSPKVCALQDRLVLLLSAHPNYEHMVDTVKRDVDEFFCRSAISTDSRLVNDFVRRHRRDEMTLHCFFEVEGLEIKETLAVGKVVLLPSDAEVPKPTRGEWDRAGSGCIAKVPTVGTSYGRMSKRARADTTKALDVLRLFVGRPPIVTVGDDRQLRFRVGMQYVFEDGASGWDAHPDEHWPLRLPTALGAKLAASPLSALAVAPTNAFERKAHVALRWLADACRATRPEMMCLYSFFALEALLGDKDGGLKDRTLAFRRAMLNHVATGSFRHPNHVIYLYENVRSVAVHGGDVGEVDLNAARMFRVDTRGALEQYIIVGREHGLRKRSKLMRLLDQHPDGDELKVFIGPRRPERDADQGSTPT